MIGERIRQRRLELGLSQEELARRVGYKHKSAVNKIELGVNDIRQAKIIQFADALYTTPAYLMGWESQQEARIRLYAQKINDLVGKIEQLDDEDLIRLDERVDMMLEAQKNES